MPAPKRAWKDDPGHVVDVPEPPPMPDEQERVGLELPPEEIEAKQAAEEAREPQGDPAPVPDLADIDVPRALAQEIRRAMKRYPEKRSASIPALWAVQRRYGWCTPEGIEQAAAVMGLTPGYLQSVASFYDLFHLEPQGEHEVLVCTNISCWLRGGDGVLGEFMEAAGTDHPGTTSEDGKVFVRGFECLGACDIAPMASIDERYYGPLEDGDAETIVEQLRSGKDVLPEKRLEERGAAGGKKAPADKRLSRHPLNKPKPKTAGKSKRPPQAKPRRSR
jgi:NADH:ubiquinone oxidoreductase subunit E